MKVYNYTLKKVIEIEEFEYICDKCYGKGQIKSKLKTKSGRPITLRCNKCLGAGKLDWIENVTGKAIADDMIQFYPDESFQQIIENLSEDLAHNIDQEILRALYNDCNIDDNHEE